VLASFLSSIADGGRAFLERQGWQLESWTGPHHIEQACDNLLSRRGEASGAAIARTILDGYARMTREERRAFFHLLLDKFGPDEEALSGAIASYQREPSAENESRLHRAAEPRRQELFRRLTGGPGRIRPLVEMRAELLEAMEADPALRPVDGDLMHLFSSWFGHGFIMLERIDWDTPATILEKLLHHDSVHPMDGWDDLRGRLQSDRRCFAFFHPTLPGEPLIFVEVALVNGMPSRIGPLIAKDRTVARAESADTAVFFSINNCHAGLRGMSFGNFLIKQVAERLSAELHGLRTFVTLSPVPGFRQWLEANPAALGAAALDPDQLVAAGAGSPDPALMEACAQYLVHGRRGAQAADPVARFHLGNGARLERINWMADPSPNGMRQSYGIMVNYFYDLRTVEENHELYFEKGKVPVARAVLALANARGRRPRMAGAA
jgi:malonyl-CoA decarboxylase